MTVEMKKQQTDRILTVTMSDEEFERLKFTSEEMSFEEFMDIIHRDLTISTAFRSRKRAGELGFGEMSMDMIHAEVKAARNSRRGKE